MESSIKQTRVRFAKENKEESIAEKKTSQSWIRKQFSRQANSDYDLKVSADYPTAVAAAAYAIQSLEEMRTRDHKDRTTSQPDHKSSKKSKEENSVNPPESRKSVLKSSGQSSKRSFKDSGIKVPVKKPSHKKKLSSADIDETIIPQHEQVAIERPPQLPSTRPNSTFGDDRHLNIAEDKKPYRLPTTLLPRAQVQPVEAIRHGASKPGPPDSQADAWETKEMTSIRKRYEKMRATIDEWENKKKAKAKRKIEKIEAELDDKRIKSTQSHRIVIKRIEGIAGGTRTQAEENKRNEQLKIRETANKIRATGKLPPTSFCF